MSSLLTVQQLAKLLNIPIAVLIQNLKAAGVEKVNESDALTREEKNQLLHFLKNEKNSNKDNKSKQETPVANLGLSMDGKQKTFTSQQLEQAKRLKQELLTKRQTGLNFSPTLVKKAVPEKKPKEQKSKPEPTSKTSADVKKHTLSSKPKKMTSVQDFNATKDLLSKHKFEKPTQPINYDIKVPEFITVENLSDRMSIKVTDFIKSLMEMGIMVTKNQSIDQETAFLIIEEMGHKPIIEEKTTQDTLKNKEIKSDDMRPRSPIVTVMGHVDHGKTTLIDYLRKSQIANKEFGGITQHIGAYQVHIKDNAITFIDTPGHAAFSQMRANGTNLTDIVILVVAADDGIKPQTVEAIKHAQAAKVPIITAINKIDKPGFEGNIEQIKQQLGQYNVIPDEWGGDNLFFNISALKGTGIEELLSGILIQSDLLELKAAFDILPRGAVLESALKKGRGPSCTLVVQHGQLKPGNFIVAGGEYARIRMMNDEHGKNLKLVQPGSPVEVFGFSGLPEAGEEFIGVVNEKTAKQLAKQTQDEISENNTKKRSAMLQKRAFEKMENSDLKVINLIIKADTKGTAHALNYALLALKNDEKKIVVNVISYAVGGINESDVNLAGVNETIIIGFNVRADSGAKKAIQMRGLDVRYYSLIYQAIEDIESEIKGSELHLQEKILGIAEVKEVFSASKYGEIAGCVVKEGNIHVNNPIRVLRDNKVVYEGKLESLRRFKDKVTEVSAGIECGIGVKDYKQVQAGDQIEVFEQQKFHKNK